MKLQSILVCLIAFEALSVASAPVKELNNLQIYDAPQQTALTTEGHLEKRNFLAAIFNLFKLGASKASKAGGKSKTPLSKNTEKQSNPNDKSSNGNGNGIKHAQFSAMGLT